MKAVVLFILIATMSVLLVIGCSSDIKGPTAVNEDVSSQIVAPSDSQYLIHASQSDKAGLPTVSVGKLHNEALAKFHEKHAFGSEKISDPAVFFEYMHDSVHEVVDTSVFDISKSNFEQDYVPVLYELRDCGGFDFFSCELLNSDAIGTYFETKGWLTSYEADWLVGIIDAISDAEDPIQAQIAINQYTFLHGLPVPGSPLSTYYDITIHSLSYWSDSSKWGMNWRGVLVSIGDGLSGAAGAFIGGTAGSAAGPGGTAIGAIIGGVYLGAVGSGAVEMMCQAWDEFNQ